MKRPTKGYSGQEVALFPTMQDVTAPSTLPSRITSSPSPLPDSSPSHSPEPSSQHSPDNTTAAASQPSPTQPSPTHPSPEIGVCGRMTLKKTNENLQFGIFKLIPQGSTKLDIPNKKKYDQILEESGANYKISGFTGKRQKMEEDAEKEELKGFLDIVPREEVPIERIFGRFQETIKVLSGCLKTLNKLDGDLHTCYELDEDDEIWKNQHEYNVISWSLYDFCVSHFTDAELV
ncbi:hypothetical protein Tco_0428255 [Tanacetum coccineum]